MLCRKAGIPRCSIPAYGLRQCIWHRDAVVCGKWRCFKPVSWNKSHPVGWDANPSFLVLCGKMFVPEPMLTTRWMIWNLNKTANVVRKSWDSALLHLSLRAAIQIALQLADLPSHKEPVSWYKSHPVGWDANPSYLAGRCSPGPMLITRWMM